MIRKILQYIFYGGNIVSGVVHELSRILAEMHNTTQEEELKILTDILPVLREQDLDAKIWLMMMWFALDQVRIMKHLQELGHDIKRMTDAMRGVSTTEEKENPESQDSSINIHI